MAAVSLVGVGKCYGTRAVLEGVDLTVTDGEFLTIAGPSGSGKTTLLRLVAGLEVPSAGRILIDGRDVTSLPAEARNLSMVFQDYALFPHRTAEGNIAFPLQMQRVPASQRHPRAARQARRFRIEHLLGRFPGQLAAGHQQLVATARALVRDIGLLLMDEPLVHLDARTREAARVELKRLQQDLGTTVLYVTNDQTEALALGRRVAVLAEGKLQQVAPPDRLYGRPANTFVAGFVGTRPMNLLPGELHPAERGAELVVGDDRLRVEAAALRAAPGWRDWLDMPVTVGLRPEHLTPARPGCPFARCLHGRVRLIEDHGDERFVLVDLGFPGGAVWARLGPGDRPQPDDPVELAAALERIVLFDPAGGAAI